MKLLPVIAAVALGLSALPALAEGFDPAVCQIVADSHVMEAAMNNGEVSPGAYGDWQTNVYFPAVIDLEARGLSDAWQAVLNLAIEEQAANSARRLIMPWKDAATEQAAAIMAMCR